MPYGFEHQKPKAGSKRGGGYLCAHCSKATEKHGCHNQACAPVYFASRMEKVRAAELLFHRDRGKIKNLEFHPRFDLMIYRPLPDGTMAPGVRWRTIVLDFRYVVVDLPPDKAGATVTEDVKPKRWKEFDEPAMLKIDLFRILFPDVNLVIVER